MTSIKLKKSSVAGKIPTDSDLAHGELAINFQDGKLFYKDASNNVKAFIDSAAVGSLITAGQGLDSDGVKSVHFGDNESLTFGDDSDFKITHTPNRTVLHDAGTGEIMVRTNQFRIRNPGNTETLAKFVQDGASELYHNNSKKIETKTTGATVTGHLNADSAELSGKLRLPQIGNALEFGASAGGGGTNAIDMNNCNIIGINRLVFNDPGAGEGLQFDNIKLFESPDDQSNAAGSLQVTYNNARIFTVSDSGVNITGNLRINDAPADFGLDSTNVINLIDSDYVLNRSGISIPVLSEDSSLAFNQRLSFQSQTTIDGVLEVQPKMSVLDSAGTETLVNVNFTGGGGIDSGATIAIINDRFTTDVTFGGDVTFDSAGALFFDKSFKVLKFGDNYQAQFGDDADLKIYHDGSNSIIEDAGTGMLDVKASYFRVTNANGSKIAAQFSDFTGPAGGAQLFFDGTKRFETKDSGVNVIGQITADSATISGPATISDDVTFDSAGAVFFDKSDKSLKIGENHIAKFGENGDFEVKHTNGNSILKANNGPIFIQSNATNFGVHIGKLNASETMGKFIPDGAVELYHNNIKKFETTDSGVTVTGRLRADSATIAGLRFPVIDGDANQAIITDGAGNLTFGTVSGGGGGSGGVAGTTNAATAQSFVGDSSTTTFTMSGLVPSDSDDVLVFINGILQHTDNYSLSGNSLTLDSAPHTGDKIETRKLAVRSTNVSLRDYRNYIYTTTGSSTTTFSGADSSGTSLAYDVGKLEVYLNGSRLVNGKDYTATNGTSVVLDSAVSAGNILEVVSLAAAAVENPGVLAVDSDLTSTDSGQVIHSFDRAAFRTVKYIVQLEHDSDNKYHSEEILLSHNNTIVGMTTYAQVLLDSNLGTFDADISGTDVRLKLTPTKTNTSVKLRAIRVGA